MYLILTNISKRGNIRSLLLGAAAFRCAKVLVVGQEKFDMDPSGSDLPGILREHVKSGHLRIERFSSWDACLSYLRDHNIRLVGVEIHDDAKPIEYFMNESFAEGGDIAFLMGNEGQGISEKRMKSCDAFVRIPQYGGGTASLNVYVAASIILQRYHDWELMRSNKGSEINTNIST